MVMAGILSRGHILLEGLPGVGKTALIKALGQILNLQFRRVQFTPDLMPSDILGTHILQRNGRRRAGDDLPVRPRVHQYPAGRRNQPRQPQDPVGPAGSDAGTLGDVAGQHPAAARSVLRAGQPEPDRVGRHLSAARGPTGPFPVQADGERRFGRTCWTTSSRRAAAASRRVPTWPLLGRGAVAAVWRDGADVSCRGPCRATSPAWWRPAIRAARKRPPRSPRMSPTGPVRGRPSPWPRPPGRTPCWPAGPASASRTCGPWPRP